MKKQVSRLPSCVMGCGRYKKKQGPKALKVNNDEQSYDFYGIC